MKSKWSHSSSWSLTKSVTTCVTDEECDYLRHWRRVWPLASLTRVWPLASLTKSVTTCVTDEECDTCFSLFGRAMLPFVNFLLRRFPNTFYSTSYTFIVSLFRLEKGPLVARLGFPRSTTIDHNEFTEHVASCQIFISCERKTGPVR